MSLIVNLDEFAELVGVTAETMRVHIRAIEGDPDWLVKRGSRGRDYEIQAEAAVAWWKSKREAEEFADAERREQLKQLRLDLVGAAVTDPAELALSGKQRSEEIAATLDSIKLRRAMGSLVDRADLEHQLTLASVDLRRRLALIPGEFVVAQGLDSKLAAPLKSMIGRALDDFGKAIELPPVQGQRNDAA